MASEGKLKLIKGNRTAVNARDEFEGALAEQVESYALKPDVLGLVDVVRGVRVKYPTTIYVVAGDDTSGVAGMLYPNGDFIPAVAPRRQSRYWNYDETDCYITVVDDEGRERVVGYSWRIAPVMWDGSVAGSINPTSLTGEEGDEHRAPISRREWDGSLTQSYDSTGELWRSIKHGTSMVSRSPQAGRIHEVKAA